MKLLHFAFIGAFPARYPQYKSNTLPSYARLRATPMNSDTVNLIVGGVKYSLFGDDIRKHKASYFQELLTKSSGTDSVSLHRDGILFKFVNAFLVSGQLPRDATGRVELDGDVLDALKKEAIFFGLKDLQMECERITGHECVPPLGRSSPANLQLVESGASLTKTLYQVWQTSPIALRGSLSGRALAEKLLKKTTIENVDAEQLTLLAKKVPSENKALQINSCLLRSSISDAIAKSIDVSKLFPGMEKLEIRARKLVIRTAGDIHDPSIDSTDEKDCLGFVEVLLNSSYTGGELQVNGDGQVTELKMDPFQWVAMHADGDWTVRPVTTGSRVSLVFGIYGVSTTKKLVSSGFFINGNWWGLLESSAGYPNARQLIETAKYLQPAHNVDGATKFEIDSLFLNDDTLSCLVNDVYYLGDAKRNLHSMFPGRTLSFRPTKLQVRTKSHSFVKKADREVDNSADDKQNGFLGTLVVTEDKHLDGNVLVHIVDKNGAQSTVSGDYGNWYAVAAGGSSTVEPIASGNRLSVQYDIYDATPNHDPLTVYNAAVDFDNENNGLTYPDDGKYYDDDCNETGEEECDSSATYLTSQLDTPVARTTVSNKIAAEVLAAVETELTTNDAVVICLQHVYPEHKHNNDPSYLKGGDRALYNMLTKTSQYDVQPILVTLHSALDSESGRNKIVSGTHAHDFPGDSSTSTATKLFVPVTLTSEHQRAEDKEKSTYFATGLRVTKKSV